MDECSQEEGLHAVVPLLPNQRGPPQGANGASHTIRTQDMLLHAAMLGKAQSLWTKARPLVLAWLAGSLLILIVQLVVAHGLPPCLFPITAASLLGIVASLVYMSGKLCAVEGVLSQAETVRNLAAAAAALDGLGAVASLVAWVSLYPLIPVLDAIEVGGSVAAAHGMMGIWVAASMETVLLVPQCYLPVLEDQASQQT